MSYDYDYIDPVETTYHVLIRKEPRTDADVVTEVDAGIRMIAASSVQGDSYHEAGGGSDWLPVAYELAGTTLHGFLAQRCTRNV
jgi:hypothetical protein